MGYQFADWDLFGGFLPNGAIQVYYDHEAIKNSITLFLLSYPYSLIRRPSVAGTIVSLLSKPLSEDKAEDIETGIYEVLSLNFRPSLKINAVKVTPDYDKDLWDISIDAYSVDFKRQISIHENYRAI